VSRKRLRILRIRSAVSHARRKFRDCSFKRANFLASADTQTRARARALFEKLELTFPPLFMSRKIRKYADEGGIAGAKGRIQARILFALVFLVRMTIESSMNDY